MVEPAICENPEGQGALTRMAIAAKMPKKYKEFIIPYSINKYVTKQREKF